MPTRPFVMAAVLRQNNILRSTVPLTTPQRALVEEYMTRYPNPIAVFAKVHYGTLKWAFDLGYDQDEIEQLCWLGVIKAAKLWEEDREDGCSFDTYAVGAMKGVVGSNISTMRRDKRNPTTGEIIQIEDWTGLRAKEKPEEDPADFAELSLLRECLATLRRREQIILALRFCLIDGKVRTLSEIGVILKITRERVRQIQSKATEKLRDRMSA